MKRTKEELLSQIKVIIGDNTSDEVLTLLTDINDTLDGSTDTEVVELRQKVTDLETKVKETDEAWRQKYRDAFFSPQIDPQPTQQPDDLDAGNKEVDEDEKETFDDLFSTKGDK